MHEVVIALTTTEHDQLDRLLTVLRQHGTSAADEQLCRSIFLYGMSALVQLQRDLGRDGGPDGLITGSRTLTDN